MSRGTKFHHVYDDAENPGDEDKVGYCKPPKHSRFRRGQSGNPRGRPRVAYEEHDIPFRRYMMETTTAKFNGKKMKVTKFDALFFVLYQMALKGDFRSIKLLVEQTGGFKEFRADYKREMTEADREMIKWVIRESEEFMARSGAKEGADDDVDK